RDAPDDPELRTRALDAIRRCAELQARIVDDLLDVARAATGKLRVELQPVELAPVLTAAVQELRPAAASAGVHLLLQLEPLLPRIEADAHRLRQVISNLLSNAIKFTAAGGNVTLSVQRRRANVIITVRDTGRGIKAELLPHLFEPFSQDESSSGEGMGLGLAIARQLVELHGGTIRAQSDGPRTGASFVVSLPVPGRTGAETTDVPSAPPKLAGLRVLLVDDHREMLDALAHLLRAAGATVECVESAAAAWQTIATKPPDVLVTDLAMPVEDGYALLRRIRSEGPSHARALPAVALSAHTTTAERTRSLAAGFDAHVGKPVDLERLLDTLAKLGRRRIA
ncbi:MAG: response regulator, partial [Kofleriaceae bacterium]